MGDDDAGTALFTVAGRRPGDVVANCIEVAYDGPEPAQLVLSATSAGDGLDGYLDIDMGTGTRFGDCQNFQGSSI